MNNNTEKEIWKDIKDYEGLYQVSSAGRIRSVDRVATVESVNGTYQRKLKGKMLSPNDNGHGYLSVQLTKGNRRYIHILVAEHFIDRDDDDKTDINHIDNDTYNNHAYNLEWCTHKENIKYAVKQGRQCKGETRWNSKLTEEEVIEIKSILNKGELTQREIGERYGVSQSVISEVSRGISWKHV